MQFFGKTNIDFVGKRGFFAVLSICLILGGLIVTIVITPDFSIDFVGGTEIGVEFKSEKTIEAVDIKESIEKSEVINSAEVKTFGGTNQFLIRVKDIVKTDGASIADNTDVVDAVYAALDETYPDIEREELKVDTIGPKIGAEMKKGAVLAILLAVICILLYIAFRFELVYGFGAVIALIHDVVITFTLLVIFNAIGLVDIEVNQNILAAMLMVLGYSINDTVVIFDRIRENLERQQGHSYLEIINISINEVLSRTVNTSLSSLMVMVTLAVLGGPVLFGFAFTMIIGLVAGTYSSIYIASSFVIWYQEKIKKIDAPTPGKKSKKSLRTA